MISAGGLFIGRLPATVSYFVMESFDNVPILCSLTDYSPRGYSTLLGPFVEVPIANKVQVRLFPKFPKFVIRQVGGPLQCFEILPDVKILAVILTCLEIDSRCRSLGALDA